MKYIDATPNTDERKTRWYNPTRDTLRVEIHRETLVFVTGPGGKPVVDQLTGENVRIPDPRTDIYMVPPGGELELPSKYDHAMQHVQAGIIMGGIGSRFINRSVPNPPPLHAALSEKPAATLEDGVTVDPIVAAAKAKRAKR